MKSQEQEDLSRLATKRCRDAVMSVTQLIEDDDVFVISLLLTIAQDFIGTAGIGLAQMKDVPNEEGIAKAMLTVMESFGVKNIAAMLKEISNVTKRTKNTGV